MIATVSNLLSRLYSSDACKEGQGLNSHVSASPNACLPGPITQESSASNIYPDSEGQYNVAPPRVVPGLLAADEIVENGSREAYHLKDPFPQNPGSIFSKAVLSVPFKSLTASQLGSISKNAVADIGFNIPFAVIAGLSLLFYLFTRRRTAPKSNEHAAPRNASKPGVKPPRLYITGLGSHYPPHALDASWLEQIALRFYDGENPGLKKLLQVNRHTGIQTRTLVDTYETGFGTEAEPPSIADIDKRFRKVGVDLAAEACIKALKEWGGDWQGITHTVAVTCTNEGHPGYDLLVNQKLGLSSNVERVLLHGVGCAGGLSIMRVAAQIADGAAIRGRPARILAYACEVCSLSYRYELELACKADPANVSIAPSLFSDGAAAFVLCNEQGKGEGANAVFELMGWGNTTIPATGQHLGFFANPQGYQSVLTREVPFYTSNSIAPMFYKLLPSLRKQLKNDTLDIKDFDWALHPGGGAILKAAEKLLKLRDNQLWASWDIYRTKGNTSSPTVLAVLDRLRSENLRAGSDHVVAASFGPGLTIEMAILERYRPE